MGLVTLGLRLHAEARAGIEAIDAEALVDASAIHLAVELA